MKIALVYDRVNKFGGAERVLLALHEIWPKAPLYTAVYNPKTAPWAKKLEVIPSFLQRLPRFQAHHELLAPLMPLAFESFDFDEYDVVISITSEAAKGIVTKPKTLHICYCLTPTRYLWSGYKDYFSSAASRLVSLPAISYLRKWDQIAAQRPDYYLAISENVKERIEKYYQRDAEVIYPPVDTKKFEIRISKSETNFKFQIPNSKQIQNTKYFLIVSRLIPYKRIDIVIRAFNQLGWPLKIVGTGSQRGRLKRMAKPNIEFFGQLTDKELVYYYQNCQAVIFPQEEDFGLVPLEAQACGRPVIAYRGGGALEMVVEGRTGEFFYPQTAKALAAKLQSFKATNYKAEDCRKQAEKFGKEIFQKRFKEVVEEQWKRYSKTIFML